MKSKLEIITGFLGSGKTSFINSYLNTEICKGEKVLIVLLEEGTTSISNESKLIKTVYIKEVSNIKEVLLDEMERGSYKKIIIEFNGTYNLSIISNLLKDKKIKEKIRFYGNYYIGDAGNLEIYIRNMGELILPFIQSSKLIVLNNFNYLSEEKKRSLIKIIENINFTSPIIYSFGKEILSDDLRVRNYFKYGIFTRKIKTLFNKGEFKS